MTGCEIISIPLDEIIPPKNPFERCLSHYLLHGESFEEAFEKCMNGEWTAFRTVIVGWPIARFDNHWNIRRKKT